MSEDVTPPAGERALGASRRTQILSAVRRYGTVRVAQLATQFAVTPVTIRRDLDDLAEAGVVTRVHGGATVTDEPTPSVATRRGTPATPRHGLIGMLVPSLTVYWPDIARSVESEVRRAGLRLLLHESSYSATDERPDLDGLVDAGCVGILAAPNMSSESGERTRAWLREAPVPVVLVERTAVVDHYQRAVPSVISDHRLGGEMATHHLAQLGHRRIGAVLADTPHTKEIQEGWERATAALGLAPAPVAFVPNRHTAEFEPTLTAALEAFLADGVTGLFVHSDPEAVRLAQMAARRGTTIPQDLSVVSYDDEVAALASPPLTALRPQRQEVGRAAVALLLERLADPARAIHRVAISPTLVVRESSRPLS